MSKFFVEAGYSIAVQQEIELPDKLTLADLKGYYVKWNLFNYTIDGETWHEQEIGAIDEIIMDTDVKRPDFVAFYAPDDTDPEFCGEVLDEYPEYKDCADGKP